MRFYREKSWLLGLLALIAPLPLPFNQVVGWAPVLAFCAAAAVFMWRTSNGSDWVLPYWIMNLLGLLYIPFLIGDASTMRIGRILAPLVHLALYAMAVKLFALRKEKDKWHLFLGVFFLFIASMSTSVHPAAVLYLIAFGTVATLTLIRFAGLHTVSTVLRSTAEPVVPLRRFLTGTLSLSIVVAIPLFFFLPRLKQPYVYVPTGGAGGVVQVSGFADRLDLGMIDRVRSTRTVVLRFLYETPPPPATEMRFKAATYDIYGQGGWARTPRQPRNLGRRLDGFFHLADYFPVSWMKIWLRQGNDRVVLPVETTVADIQRNGLTVDGSGEARFLLPRPGTAEYRAGLAAEPVIGGWRDDHLQRSDLDRSSITPRMENLASTVMGQGPLEERIRRLENHLRNEYRYSLDVDNTGRHPVERFLFDTREGHCEYFASALVMLLRSQGVGARMVTGYLGSDYNPLEGYHIVRQSNAHAWVEAFVPEDDAPAAVEPNSNLADAEGRWVVFDPTPADARPQSGQSGLAALMTQAYDYVLFRWDRYVLTYGFGDQMDTLVRLRNAWLSLWKSFGASKQKNAQPTQPETQTEDPADDEAEADGPKEPIFTIWRVAPFLVLFATVIAWLLLRRDRFSATKAYRVLRSRAAPTRGERVPDWVGPLRLEERLARRCPEAAAETEVIVSHYLRESFAGEELTEAQLELVKEALAEAKKKLRAA